jgi:SAM-dependent methyltransferase
MWAVLTDPRKWDEEEFFATGAREVAESIAYLESVEVPLRRGRALDFGCGLGRVTRPLAEYFDRVVGVDIAESMIEAARRLNESVPNCEFIHNPEPDLRCFDSGSFDLVYSKITLQHMVPSLAKSYLAEFVRVVSDDGLILFQVTSRPKPAQPGDRSAGVRRKARKLRDSPFQAAKLAVQHLRGRGMEMHGVPREEVIASIEAAGGRVLEAKPDGAAGPSFESYTYAAVREPGGADD